MRCEDIENSKLNDLVYCFYIYQAALIRTDLSLSQVYPKLFEKYQEKLGYIKNKLENLGIYAIKLQLPPESNSIHPNGSLQNFKRQNSLKEILKNGKNGELILPPENLDLQVQMFINTLPTPWE